jgi:DNA-binding GntR family transcriptional regulator
MDKLEEFLTEQPSRFPKTLSRRELAYERIKAAIWHADLEAGEPLTETRLSKLLGISRTPVREALQQLVQEGLAESTPGHAVTVASRNIQDVLNVVHIRSLLEPELVRLAAEAASSRQVEELDTTMQVMEQAAEKHDLATWSKADVVFHKVVKEACPNGLLGETVVQLKTRVHHLANIDTHTDPTRLVRCTEEHREVVDAIKSRDGIAAKAAMEKHISALTNSLLRRISYR